jgi:hypothetical protein
VTPYLLHFQIEWFHYECVGVTADTVPDSWYCSDCQKLKDAGKI